MGKMFKKFIFLLFLTVTMSVTSACGASAQDKKSESEMTSSSERSMGMGPGSGMMNRHHAQVPEAFAGLTNPVNANDESLERGEEIYFTHCATCHGDYGNGDGPGGVNLDPAPAAIAHTSQMMSDAYLFWRITEGGTPFNTGMISYQDILVEEGRWDVINYIRALGGGQVSPRQRMGGEPFDAEQEQAQRKEMLMAAVEQEVISQIEADVFDQIHTAMDKYLVQAGASGMDTGPRADALPQILAEMIGNSLVTQENADIFMSVHDRLIEAGLMQ
jgi:mono/diheme cytochrome c family protein